MDIGRRAAIFGIAAISVGGIGAYWAGFGRDMPGNSQYFSVDGVALRGADPVAYFAQGKPMIGNSGISLDWGGTVWHFTSDENRQLFEANPQAYAPQFGGYCAWAVAEKGLLYSTQPTNWTIVEGKLYLNYDDGVQETWNTERADFIARGDERWPEVKTQLN